MRILWLCNIMLPVIAKSLGRECSNKEGWLTGLSDRIMQDKENRVTLGVCFPVGKEETPVKGETQGLSYFSFHENTLDAHHYDAGMEAELRRIVTEFQPDVVHVFGTEYPHTLAMLRSVPDVSKVLVGIQGLCFEYSRYYMADLPQYVIDRPNFRDLVRKDTLKEQKRKYEARGSFEKEALRLVKHVTGRTGWDYKLTESINPERIYHFMGETLRAPFYQGEWNCETCVPHRIFMSQGNYPIKGLHYVLPALAKLKEEFPDIKLCVAGDRITAHTTWKEKLKLSSYGKYLLELIQKYGLGEQIEFLGKLDAEQMKEQYLKSHVFLSPSAIENSPNSIGEALMLGVPVVSSDCGGVRSLFTDEQEGLFYETTDTDGLIRCLRRYFTDTRLVEKTHQAARKRAFQLHDPEKNYQTLLQIYGTIAHPSAERDEKSAESRSYVPKVTFVSNYINHHQIPFSNEMFERLGERYHFIQTEPMEEERVSMGWGVDVNTIPYLMLFYEQKEECERLILESDIVVFGGTEREDIVEPRLRAGLPVIRYSERLYREGQWKAVSPRGLRKKYHDHTRYRKEDVYLLCSGAYVASDFHIVRAYPGKMLKWGYFPEQKKIEKDLLPNAKQTKQVNILWAGRFLELKHPEYAVLAAERLNKTGFNFKLTMIGDGEKRSEIERMIVEKGLSGVVALEGYKKPQEVRDKMERSHIFLFTSNHLEGWGAVLNEAMNSGCAVLADSAVGAAPFLIQHGVNGMVYREGDLEGFLALVEKLVQDAELRKRLGENAYQTIERFWNPRNAAECLLRLCEGILRGQVRYEKEGPVSPAKIIAPRKGYEYCMQDGRQ
ncbi:MAG: glycosyltransferase family 4 protein [Clostridiales bacterium]|nr:glycosyltransferase family 4 protein [Clostridiales bacterium]